MGHSPATIRQLRLANQRLGYTRAFRRPPDAVSWFGAMQAQDYLGALWAIGLRTRDATQAAIEDAENRRAIVRTWPMRGTLHFVAAEDARWITRLLTPRVIARNSARWKRDFGVDPRMVARADEVVSRALEGGRRATREGIYDALETRRIRTGGSRGLHLLLCLAMQGRVCLAGRIGKQHAFALLDEWIPKSRDLAGEEAMAELALRYFTSHGPATLKDFMWWAGVTAKHAAAALAQVAADLESTTLENVKFWWRDPAGSRAMQSARPGVRLLPAFDEYTVAYEDRSLLVEGRAPESKMALLSPAVLVDGRVVGTWKRTLGRASVKVEALLTRKLLAAETAALHEATQEYARYLSMPSCDLAVRVGA